MKKLTLLFLSLITFFNARSQVSDSFYNNFKETVRRNYEKKENTYSAVFDALRACIDFRNDAYYAEIKRYTQNGISDSAALSLIPNDIMKRFMEHDFEPLFCPDVHKAKALMTFYAESFCRVFTPKYEALPKNKRVTEEASLLVGSIKELTNDPDFKQKMRTYAADIDAGVWSSIENEIVPWFYLQCPALKEGYMQMPELLGRNNLRSIIRDQRLELSDRSRFAIANNKPDTLQPFFLTAKAFEAFRATLGSRKTETAKYRAGKGINDIAWPDNTSIIQTFATADKNKDVTILFQLRYSCQQRNTRLFIDNVIYIPAAEIKDKAAVLKALKMQIEPPPDVVDPYWKPLPPKPEENKVVH